jgi:hypothetical protein
LANIITCSIDIALAKARELLVAYKTEQKERAINTILQKAKVVSLDFITRNLTPKTSTKSISAGKKTLWLPGPNAIKTPRKTKREVSQIVLNTL